MTTTRIWNYSALLAFNKGWREIIPARSQCEEQERLFSGIEARITRIVRRGYELLVREVLPFNERTLLLRGDYGQSERERRDFQGLLRLLSQYGSIDLQQTLVMRSNSSREGYANDENQ